MLRLLKKQGGVSHRGRFWLSRVPFSGSHNALCVASRHSRPSRQCISAGHSYPSRAKLQITPCASCTELFVTTCSPHVTVLPSGAHASSK